MCDADNNTQLSQSEIHACVDKQNMTAEEKEEMHHEIEENFNETDVNGDGEIN